MEGVSVNIISALFDGSFMPHGHCLKWQADLLFLHVVGDMLTVIAYFLIPVALIQLVRKRDDLAFNWIFVMFAAFIFLCGVTHLMALINIWHGYYFLSGLSKLATGIISIITTVMIVYLLPKVITIPSNKDFKVKNEQLLLVQKELLEANQLLEQRVEARTRELEKLARTDALTGVLNRGGLMNNLTDEIDRSVRYKHPLSLLMIDLDHFKYVNDQFGHQRGDTVLIEAVNIISKASRHSDMLGRYGGEEFLLLLPETNLTEAKILAERIRHDIEQHPFCQDEALNISLTCSIGVTEYEAGQTQSKLLQTVDRLLYSAKNSGRNRVTVNDNIDN
jgi:diguanylate cyclase (GGDEF)-like protein